MKFVKSYDGTRPTYRIAYSSFVKPLNYLSPRFEYLLRSKHVKRPKFNPAIKRLNHIETAGHASIIKNN